MNKLKLAVLKSAKYLSLKINEELKNINQVDEDFLLNIDENRFSNGEGKIRIEESIDNSNLFILSDVGNYDVTFQMRGRKHYMGPDEHFEDIKRLIAAAGGNASSLNVIMPLLYESRQHRWRRGESLDCAIALQDLEHMGVNSIMTFDAHDPSVCNAIPRLPFYNFYPTHLILDSMLEREEIGETLVISPDMGAMQRARFYADMLKCDVGVFYKRRDLSKVVNGKNPIVEHMYMGVNPKGKDAIVVDDMIASGTSILEVAESLKERGARKVYLVSTFALFTEGIENFKSSYENGLFDGVYSTNLSYVPENIRSEEWFREVDCSSYMAEIINSLHRKENIDDLWKVKSHVLERIEKKRGL